MADDNRKLTYGIRKKITNLYFLQRKLLAKITFKHENNLNNGISCKTLTYAIELHEILMDRRWMCRNIIIGMFCETILFFSRWKRTCKEKRESSKFVRILNNNYLRRISFIQKITPKAWRGLTREFARKVPFIRFSFQWKTNIYIYSRFSYLLCVAF